MTKYLVEKDTLDDLADAIREQTGDENPMKLADFASNVRSISGGNHTYSTTEQEVGTWVDGSTVYEKTIAVNNQIVKSTWVYIDTIADISKIINSSVIVYENSGGRTYGVREGYFCEASTNDGGKVGLYNNTNFEPTVAYVTIRYTKVTVNSQQRNIEEQEEPEEENREQEENER